MCVCVCLLTCRDIVVETAAVFWVKLFDCLIDCCCCYRGYRISSRSLKYEFRQGERARKRPRETERESELESQR